MSADEIRVRALGLWRQRRERGVYGRTRRRRDARRPARLDERFDVQNLREATKSLVPGSASAQLDALSRRYPDTCRVLAASSASRAKTVLSGEWSLLGQPVDLRQDVDWHRDPVSGACWPRTFYADLSLHDGRAKGDVKYVWELGRHQFLVELARGWLFTRNERFAQRARVLIADWIRQNPLYEGVHWASGLEVAMRAISWLWTAATLGAWDAWRDEDLREVAESLADHAVYLENHFSFYSSPYNHLIGEATALYLLGTVLQRLDAADRWRRLGRQVLAEHAPRQFYRDGFSVEQATGYHFYTLGFLSMAIAASRAEGDRLEGIEPAVHQAYRAGACLRRPDGRWPAVGDVDSARSIPVHHDDFWDFNSLSSLGAVLFDDRELAVSGSSPGEEVYWLLGCDGLDAWKRLAGARPGTSAGRMGIGNPSYGCVLEESGYCVARREDDWLLFDAGPLGDGLHADATPSTAHGHADTFQVLFHLGGKEALVDPGMPFYFGALDWVRHFRSAAAHNTLEIDGIAVAQPAGRMEWSHVAPTPRLDANLSEQAWLARGRAVWGQGVLAERNILALPGRGLWIADWIETDRPRRVTWNWQLPAGAVERLVRRGPTAYVVRGKDLVLAGWSDSAPVQIQMSSPNEQSPAGWIAPGYGLLRAGQRLSAQSEPADRVLVATYVGHRLIPAELTMRGRRLVCTTAENGKPTAWDHDGCACDAEVAWRVCTERGVVTISAGVAAVPAGPEWIPLHGTGNWTACSRFQPLGATVGSPVAARETHDLNRSQQQW
jgi:hypothetical protein